MGSQASATLVEPPVMLMPNSRAILETIQRPAATALDSWPGSVLSGCTGKLINITATLPYSVSCPGAMSSMRASGRSNSSATSSAKAVCTPWPISLRGMANCTPPSRRTRIQPFSATACVGEESLEASSSGAPKRLRGGRQAQPTTKAPAAPTPLNNQVRRFMNQPIESTP